MVTLIVVLHVFAALILIALVLLQDSKSDGLGGAFGGGGSNSILGATGGATLAQKLTRGVAVAFAITSISLTVVTKQNKSVIDGLPATSAAPVPASSTQPGPEAPMSDAAATAEPVTTTLPTTN